MFFDWNGRDFMTTPSDSQLDMEGDTDVSENDLATLEVIKAESTFHHEELPASNLYLAFCLD